MRFCTATLGCKANQYDTGTVEEIMCARGHEQVKPGEGCDVCIVNTCAVTAESVRKSVKAIRRMKKLEPEALIAVCGCYSQLERETVKRHGIDVIGGTGDKEGFVKEIENRAPSPPATVDSTFNFQLSTINLKTRALLKIQDGCDSRCAYCVIPMARGHSRSVPATELAAKAAALEKQGYKEIVITGIEISSYTPDLLEALRAISAAAPGVRLRLGSLNPEALTADFIKKLGRIPNICSHFHISLQSGCDETLAAMERKYGTAQVYSALERLRKAFDNCAAAADLIVGFPGETDAQFGQTLNFIDKAAFSDMHVFPFSPRPGTKAALMPNQVAGYVKQQRARTAIAVAAKLSERYKHAQIGKTLDVLFERKKEKYSIGHSGNYQSVAVPYRSAKHGKISKNTMRNVKISSVKDGVLFGEIVHETI